jgi:DNA polymerase-3 subunit delta
VGNATITLLWGDDRFLLREAALELLEGAEAREVDAASWRGGETADLATPSLLGERRALLVTDCRSLSREAVRELAGYLAAPAPDATLVLAAAVADRGRSPTSLVKLVAPAGEVRQVALSRKDLPAWIARRASKHGADVDPAAAGTLVEVLGEEPAVLDQAVVQLRSAYPGRTVTRELVLAQFRGLGEQHMWDLCDSAFGKDAPGAIHALRSMLEQRGDPLMILGGIASRLRDLLRIRSLPDRMPLAQVVAAAGLRFDWQARRYRDQARRFSIEELVGLHAKVVEVDRALKSGADGEVVLPVLVSAIADSGGGAQGSRRRRATSAAP